MNLKICFVLNSFQVGGGIQERRAMIANHWARQGIEVTIIVPVKPKKPITNLHESIRIVYVGNWQNKARYNSLSILGLIRFFSSNKFDAVFAATPQMIFLTSIALLFSFNDSKLIGSVHGTLNSIGGMKERLTNIMVRISLFLSKGRLQEIFGVSYGVSRDVATFLKRDNVLTIHNPVIDSELSANVKCDKWFKEHCRKKLYPDDWKRIVIAVGRLNNQKGFDLLIEAFSQVSQDAHLVILGAGELEVELTKLTGHLDLNERVHLLGYKPNPIEFIAGADCFVLSSRYEGFGNVLVEALFAQTPIVSFDCEHGPSDILGDNKYGRLVDCFSIDDLAGNINETLESCAGFTNVRWRDFTVENVAKRYLGLVP